MRNVWMGYGWLGLALLVFSGCQHYSVPASDGATLDDGGTDAGCRTIPPGTANACLFRTRLDH